METGRISISRAARQSEFPARFQLVAAMNPCPCGYHGDPDIQCRCTPDQIAKYAMRISGPFLDRIDLHVQVSRLSRSIMQSTKAEECSASIRKRVAAARSVQIRRQGVVNCSLEGKLLTQHATLDKQTQTLFDDASDQLSLSLRAIHRVLRVARTIADIDASDNVASSHLVEALSYRARR